MNARPLATIAPVALIAIVGLVALTGGEDDPVPAAAEPDLAPLPTVAHSNTTTEPEGPPPDLPDRGVHPELRAIDGWLQSDVTSLEELRGQVVAVQFWAGLLAEDLPARS